MDQLRRWTEDRVQNWIIIHYHIGTLRQGKDKRKLFLATDINKHYYTSFGPCKRAWFQTLVCSRAYAFHLCIVHTIAHMFSPTSFIKHFTGWTMETLLPGW